MKRLIISTLIMILAALGSNAQNAASAVRGSVKGADGKALESATVYLHSAADSAIVKIGVTDKNGAFAFEEIKGGRYLVSVTAIAHETIWGAPFTVSNGGSADIPVFTMNAEAKSMSGVTVSSKKPLIEQKIDRTIVNVEASVTNVGSSALEVLEKSPGVSIDKDGNISLKGKEGVMVLVDGRPTYLSGPDLANMLSSMQASQLAQIEIMTNPPAKYDASGNAGVINIKTKKTKQFGYSGSISLGYGQGRYPKVNESFNFNYRRNKVNLFTTISHNYRRGFENLDIVRNFRDADSKEILSHFDQQARMNDIDETYSAKLGMDYSVSPRTTLGVVLNGYNNTDDFRNLNTSLLSDEHGSDISRTDAISEALEKWRHYSANLNLRHSFDSTGRELTADADYLRYDASNDQVLINSYFDPAGNATRIPDTIIGAQPSDISIYSARVDYVHPLKKGYRFDAGLKSSYVKTDNEARYDSLLNNELVPDLGRSNHFIYEENINAAYVNFSGPLSKKFNMQLGLRMEQTIAKGNQLGNAVQEGSSFKRDYIQLFPTAYIQYVANEKNSMVLNYGRRIQRPNYSNLNPFINFLDRYTFQQGNPDLKPQFSHNVELSHTYNSFLTTTVNYSATNNIIQQVIDQVEADTTTFVKQDNIAKRRQLGVSVSIMTKISKWWTGNVYMNVYHNIYEGKIGANNLSVEGTTFMFNASQQFKLAEGLSAELNGFYRTRSVDGVFAINAFGMVNAGISKQVLNNKGTIRINVSDIFYSRIINGESRYGNVDAAFRNTRDSRVFNVGFSYRFSKGKVNGGRKNRSGSAEEEQNRVG